MIWQAERAGIAAKISFVAKFLAVPLIVLPALSVAQVRVEPKPDSWVTTNDFGSMGLLQTPTARSAPDGEFNVGVSLVSPYKRYFLTLQALPWLEATFRYTEFSNRLYSNVPAFSGEQSFKDRGADLKFRLWPESKYIPAVSLAFRDGLGTGLFSSEYLVASKGFYDLDFSLGMNWGYNAQGSDIENPLTYIADMFATRSGTGGARGGQFTVGNYFSGSTVGLFGGVAYRTPIENLVLKLEYETHDYKSEPLSSVLLQDSNWNFGAAYKPVEWLDLALGFERGNSLMFRGTLVSNVHDSGMPKFDPPPVPVKIRPKKNIVLSASSAEQVLTAAALPVAYDAGNIPAQNDSHHTDRATKRIFEELHREGIEILSFDLDGESGAIGIRLATQTVEVSTLETAAQVMLDNLPSDVQEVMFFQPNQDERSDDALMVSRAQLEENRYVEHLFEVLEFDGLVVRNFDLSQHTATIEFAKLEGSRDSFLRMASQIVQASPISVQNVNFVATADTDNTSKLIFTRAEIERENAIQNLFDNLEASGIEVQTVEFSSGQATLDISNHGSSSADHKSIASMVEKISPVRLDQITLNVSRLGKSNSKIHLTKLAEGGAWRETNLTFASSGKSIVGDRKEMEAPEALKISQELFDALKEKGIRIEGMKIHGAEVTVYGITGTFRQISRNVGRVARIITHHIPSSVETITIVLSSGGMETAKISLMRKDIEDAVLYKGSSDEIWMKSRVSGPISGLKMPDDAVANSSLYPGFNWSLSPRTRSHVGGPDQFLLYQFWLSLGAKVDIWRGLSLSTSVGRNLYNNFDKIKLKSDSVLPHVRSDIKEYLQQGESNLIRLQTDYLFSPIPDFYARLSAGIFEEMFGGFGGEALFRPFKSRIAFGFDINKVRQREYNQRLKYQNYEVITGHLSAYYDMPWYNLLGVVNVGRFLAGDTGVRFDLSREFKSGIRMGVWATSTNVSAVDFGEGSFDKGFFINLPFDLLFTQSSTRNGSFAFRPLSRDGGQMLSISPRLYDVVGSTNYKQIDRSWHRFLD